MARTAPARSAAGQIGSPQLQCQTGRSSESGTQRTVSARRECAPGALTWTRRPQDRGDQAGLLTLARQPFGEAVDIVVLVHTWKTS